MSPDGPDDGLAPEPSRKRRGRRRGTRRKRPASPGQTWAHLIMAGVLLTGLLLFWGQLATGAAACFSSLAPPPEATAETEAPVSNPRHRQIQIKRVKTDP